MQNGTCPAMNAQSNAIASSSLFLLDSFAGLKKLVMLLSSLELEHLDVVPKHIGLSLFAFMF
jgi:hypothetical protein